MTFPTECGFPNAGFGAIKEVSEVVAGLDADGSGAAVFPRQYMRMNAVMLKFSVEPDFSDVVDGLVMVDLSRSDRQLLTRSIGGEESTACPRHHGR